ncbi:hypothetical protein GY45DRAFT_1367274 [Cubamyces sp. BRFM 1775]|nr:hypothetical protein GY45DRAFT_1367274 [Cubamyces sp. BRFM 1775]
MSSVLPPVKPSATYPLPAASEDDGTYPGGGNSSSSSNKGSTAALSPAPRPNFVRRETDQILSYYQSEHAGRPFDYATAAAEHAQSQPSSTGVTNTTTATSTSTSPTSIPAPQHARQPSAFSTSSPSEYSSRYSSESSSAPREHASNASVSQSESPSQLSTPVRAHAEPLSESQPQSAHGVAARHSRRPSVPTEGGADRRRLAIVEMDAPAPLSVSRKRSKQLSHDHGSSSSSSSSPMSTTTAGTTLFSRRGMHIGGLALVAPPDASPTTYTNLTPPSTAPVAADRASHPPPTASSHYHAHARSASEAIDSRSHSHSHSHSHSGTGSSSRAGRGLHHKSSRDVGIVGLSSASTASDSLGPASPVSDDYHMYVQHEGLGVPLFQTPAKSRSPSPGGGGTTPDLSDTSTGSASAYHRSPGQRLLSTPIFGMEDGIVTPGIGEYKDIQQPVVGPVIVGLSPELLQRAQQPAPQQQQQQQKSVASAAPQHHHPSQAQSPSSSSPASTSASSSSPYQSPPAPSPTSYLHYKPGVHSTAGPLPPPPRSIFDTTNPGLPPPRPPRYNTPLPPGARREIEAIKEKLQLPQSVSAALAARTPPEANRRLGEQPSASASASASVSPSPSARSDTRDSEESSYSQDNESSVKLVTSSSVHRREGAFPPSTILTSPPGQQFVQSPRASEELSTASHADSRPVVVIEHDHESEHEKRADDVPVRERKDSDRRSGLELRRESSWVSLRQELGERQSSPNGKSAVLPNVNITVDVPANAPISRTPSSVSGTSSSSSSNSSSSRLPVPPPKNGRGGSDDEREKEKEKASNTLAPSSFRATLTSLKRFSSLPRTPSRSSRSSKHSASPGPEQRRSLSPPPARGAAAGASTSFELLPTPRRRVPPKPTIVSSWPPPMTVRDVTMLSTPRERARAYAEKINELAMYDCGLREWQASQMRPGSHPRTQSQRTARSTLQAPVPAELGGMSPQGRHVSHGSLASQATFPIRADAYTATDLSLRPIDVEASTAPPPALPYPALAQANVSRASTRTSTLLSSPTKTLAILPGAKGTGTGFFASLGRKTSVRREKGLSGLAAASPQSPNKVLTKRPPGLAASRSNPQASTTTAARDAPLPAAPAIPGGPRAAPGRIQRSKTYSVSASPPQASPPEPSNTAPPAPIASESPPTSQRQSAMARRPSLFARARPNHTSVAVAAAAPNALDPAFQRQVDKLAAILPHADRAVLAGYLRRAGEDILAIGQYLEDEKNGTLRRD